MSDVQTAVNTSIVVDAPIDRAFAVFTEDMGSWWPKEHHMLQSQESHMVFEPKKGGRAHELGDDGTECKWASVLVWEPPNRVVFTWEISPQWSLESDPAKVSEVEVRFTAEAAGRTRVDVEHRNLDRHGDGWEGLRAAVDSPEGWPLDLAAFSRRLEDERVAGTA
ncbi:MAG TPA: SRPBCC family protein [Acidimicrobiales bacterium]|jgi:uncharacterized protein YndB with AHSA1/START domain